MQETKLDGIILHYAVTDRRYMLELVKLIKPEYLNYQVQTFYGILVKNFLDPAIKDVLSKHALLDYCQYHGLAEQVHRFGQIYDKAKSIILEETGQPPASQDFKYYIKKLKARYNKDVALKAIDRIKNSLEQEEDIDEINKQFSQTVTDIRSINRVDVVDEGSVGEDADNMYSEYLSVEANPTQYKGVLVGLPSIDERTNGFNPSELIVVAGMSGTGKSLLMMNFAVNAWLGSNHPKSPTRADDGHNVVYFSLEMPRSNKGKINTGGYFNKRVLSCVSELPLESIRKGLLAPHEKDHLQKTVEFIKEHDKKYKLHVVDIPRGATPEDVELKCLEAMEKLGSIDLVAVDYLGIMSGVSEGEDQDWKEIGEIAASLHEISRTYGFPVLTASQMNRPQGTAQSLSAQKYNNLRLARSSGVVDNANIIIQIANRDDEEHRTDMPLIFTKVRDGAKGEVVLTKAFHCMRVYDGSPLIPESLAIFE